MKAARSLKIQQSVQETAFNWIGELSEFSLSVSSNVYLPFVCIKMAILAQVLAERYSADLAPKNKKRGSTFHARAPGGFLFGAYSGGNWRRVFLRSAALTPGHIHQ